MVGMIEVVRKNLNIVAERIWPLRMIRKSADSITTIKEELCRVFARVA